MAKPDPLERDPSIGIVQLLRSAAASERLVHASRLVAALKVNTTFFEATTWEDVFELVRFEPARLVVIDPYWDGELASVEIQTLLGLGLLSDPIVYADFRDKPAGHDVYTLVSLGIKKIRTLDQDDSPQELADALLDSLGLRQLAATLDAIRELLSPEQHKILRWALRAGNRPISVTSLATEYGVSTRTVRRWCIGLEGLTAGRLVQWARLLNASRVLSSTSAPLGYVTTVLRFSSSGDFSRRYARLVGSPVSDCPREDLHRTTVQAFKAAIKEARRSP